MQKITKLKSYLKSGNHITGILAMRKWGYYRLSDGIFKLRKHGLDIKTQKCINRDGVRYAEYYIPMEVDK